jgi:CRISPR/Cas system-associated endoribonuclease Cas2
METVKVKITSDGKFFEPKGFMEFVGIDSKVYRISPNQIIELPFENAMLLIKQGIATIDRNWIKERIKESSVEKFKAKLQDLLKNSQIEWVQKLEFDQLIPPAIIKNIQTKEEAKQIKEEDLQSLRIRQLLSQEMPKFQSIGQGIHNGTLYFGIKINDEDGRLLDAVVTSDKKIYVDWKNENEIKTKFGLNYRFPFYHDVLDATWSRTGKYGINKWLYGKIKKISLKKAFEKVLALQKWKVWHPDERVHKHHVLKIISTYFKPIFEMKGRELIYGESGFGKTRQTKIYQLLAFNPAMSMDFSDASIFRIIESTKATILIDNFDSVEKEKKKRILHIFNTGCYAKQKAVRSEGKTFRPTGFDVFSDMIVNSILPLDEIAENRSHITRCLRTDDPNYSRLEENNPIWQETRDMLHVCALQNWKEVKKVYEKLKAESDLFAREFERVSDTLTIAKCISESLYKEMLEYYKEEEERRKIRDLREEWLYVALEYVIEQLKEKKEIELPVKDIAEQTALQIFDENAKDFAKQVHSYKIYLGKTFRANPLFKARIKEGYSYYTFTKEALFKFCRMLKFDDLAKKLEPNLGDYYEKS